MPRPNRLMKNAHVNDKKASKGTFLRLSKYVLRQWPLFIPAVILTLLSNHLALMGPRFSGAAIDAIELSMGADLSSVWKNLMMQAIAAGEIKDLAEAREVVANSFELKHYEPTRERSAWDAAYERFCKLI